MVINLLVKVMIVSFNYLDYFILLIIILSIVSGMRRGFIEAAGGIISTIIAIFMAIIYYDQCAVLLDEQFGIKLYISELLKEKIILSPAFSDNSLLSSINMGNFLANPAWYLSDMILTVVSFILILIVVKLILGFIVKILDSLFSRGALSWVNRFLGLCLVVVKNVVIMAIIVGLIYPVIDISADLGFNGAIEAVQVIEHSLLSEILLSLFKNLKISIGIVD